eukprot:FR744216.1.p3 GENE.FR744216.1~~FR744216.1.p3  ORF type:complete len:187 (-),score=101.56 FR744216.1:724-1218(-)
MELQIPFGEKNRFFFGGGGKNISKRRFFTPLCVGKSPFSKVNPPFRAPPNLFFLSLFFTFPPSGFGGGGKKQGRQKSPPKKGNKGGPGKRWESFFFFLFSIFIESPLSRAIVLRRGIQNPPDPGCSLHCGRFFFFFFFFLLHADLNENDDLHQPRKIHTQPSSK